MCKIIRWMREERHEIKSYVGRGICMCILKTAYIPRFSEYMIRFSFQYPTFLQKLYP